MALLPPPALHRLLLHRDFMDAVCFSGTVSDAIKRAAPQISEVAGVLGLSECVVAHWRQLLCCLPSCFRLPMLGWLVQYVKKTQPVRHDLLRSMVQPLEFPDYPTGCHQLTVPHIEQQMAAPCWQRLAQQLQRCRQRQACSQLLAQHRTRRAQDAAAQASAAAARHARQLAYLAQQAVQELQLRQLLVARQDDRKAQLRQVVRDAAGAAQQAASSALLAAETALGAARACRQAQAQARKVQKVAQQRSQRSQHLAQQRSQRAQARWRTWRLKLSAAAAVAHRWQCKAARSLQRLAQKLLRHRESVRWSEHHTHPLLLARALLEHHRGPAAPTYRRLHYNIQKHEHTTGPLETAVEAVQNMPEACPAAWLLDLRIVEPHGATRTVHLVCTFSTYAFLKQRLWSYVCELYVDHLVQQMRKLGPLLPASYELQGLWSPMLHRMSQRMELGCVISRRRQRACIQFCNGNKGWVHTASLAPSIIPQQVIAPYTEWTEHSAEEYSQELHGLINAPRLRAWFGASCRDPQRDPVVKRTFIQILVKMARHEQQQ